MAVKDTIDSHLEDLQKIIDIGTIDLKMDFSPLVNVLVTDESKEYLRGLRISKTEQLLSDKFFLPIVKDLISQIPQANVGSGWVDYAILGTRDSLPALLELKALHTSSGKLNELSDELAKMKAEYFQTKSNQVVRYLAGGEGGHDYVILTNLNDVYYFSREAISEFEPFYKGKFKDFIEDLKLSRNVWEVVRRRDEAVPRANLDKNFFIHLREWYGSLRKLKWKEDAEESSVLLINKLVFSLTLEDNVVIPYRYTLGEYDRVKRKFERKGPLQVLTRFFKEIDEFLFMYYDTELFGDSGDIIKRLERSKDNMERAMESVEFLLGHNLYSAAFATGLYTFNYRMIDEDVFGKSYETFLAEERKDMGIFYTPKQITNHMSSELVTHLFRGRVDEIIGLIDKGNLEEAGKKINEVLQIKIIDPACGSGPFLVGCLRGIFAEYRRIDEKTLWATKLNGSSLSDPEEVRAMREKTYEIRALLGLSQGVREEVDYRGMISRLIVSHLYGVDLDEKALDVAKVNIWKEAIKLHPQSFVYSSLPTEENHILPDLRLNFVRGDSIVSPSFEKIVHEISKKHKADLVKLSELRADYVENPVDPSLVDKILEIRDGIRQELMRQFEGNMPLLFPLEFFFAYFDDEGFPLPSGVMGFDGVIGNPPWNNIKPTKKEFAGRHPEIFGEVTKFSITGKDFEKLFREKLIDKEVADIWKRYEGDTYSLSKFIRANYQLRGKGDSSLQKTFMERFTQLSKDCFAILVPSNFHTDEGSFKLRQEIFSKWQLDELISFENRGKVWFPDIHAQFKFDMLFTTKEKTGKPFKARFYVKKWEEIEESFDYPIELIPLLSPQVLGVTEFRSQYDIGVVSKIRGKHPLFSELGISISREFDETNDKDLFITEPRDKGITLYEGKMINQYTSNYSKNKYWISEDEGRNKLIRSQTNSIFEKLKSNGNEPIKRPDIVSGLRERKLLFDYEVSRVAFRDIGRSTDGRSLISSVIPKRNFLANTVPYIEPFGYKIENEQIVQIPEEETKYYLLGLLNSFTIDYYIRQRITSHLNFFFVYELPIPQPDREIKQRVIALAKALMGDPSNRLKRAELEFVIARELFKLNKEEMNHILDSFIYGNIDKELVGLIKQDYEENSK